MRWKFLALFFLIGVAAVNAETSPTPAASPATPKPTPRRFFFEPEPIVDTWIEKMGGLQAWEKISQGVVECELTEYDGEGKAAKTSRMKMVFDRKSEPLKLKITIENGKGRRVYVQEGAKAKMFLDGKEKTLPVFADEAAWQTEFQWLLLSLPFRLRTEKVEYGYKGFTKSAEQLTHMLTIQRLKGDGTTKGDFLIFFIPKETGIPIGLQLDRASTPSQTLHLGFEAFETFGTIIHPRVTNLYDEKGQRMFSQRITKLTWNPKLAAEAFKP